MLKRFLWFCLGAATFPAVFVPFTLPFAWVLMSHGWFFLYAAYGFIGFFLAIGVSATNQYDKKALRRSRMRPAKAIVDEDNGDDDDDDDDDDVFTAPSNPMYDSYHGDYIGEDDDTTSIS